MKASQSKDPTNRGNIQKNKHMTSSVETDDDDGVPGWLRTLAIFGDSTVALSASLALFLLSTVVAWYLDSTSMQASSDQAAQKRIIEENYRKLGPVPSWIETSVPVIGWEEQNEDLFKDVKMMFDRDGVVAIRGLLESDLLDRLDQASARLVQKQFEMKARMPRGPLTGREALEKGGKQFFTVKEGAIFLSLNRTSDEEIERRDYEAFLEVSLKSKIPEIIGKFLLEIPADENLRLMRDIFLAKDIDEFVCGWHVDDTGFWPATAEAPGVNAWIALDDMPAKGGGGFALAVGSHKSDWKEEAYYVTGSTHTFPEEGFTSAMDMLDRRVGNGTCNIATAAPHLHRRMEETKRVYDLKRGDVIFHTRWLFHRTVPFDKSEIDEKRGGQDLLYRRYSIRYGPGSSVIPKGYGTELSVLWDNDNGGKTADQVAKEDAPWYPQVWPEAIDSEREQLEKVVTERFPRVTQIAEARKKQLRMARKRKHGTHRQPH